MELRLRRDDHFIADRDISRAFVILDVADANRVAVLLDRRIRFEIVHALLDVAADVPAGMNLAVDFNLAWASGANDDVAGAGLDVHVDGPTYGKRSVKMAFGVRDGGTCCESEHQCGSEKRWKRTHRHPHLSTSD